MLIGVHSNVKSRCAFQIDETLCHSFLFVDYDFVVPKNERFFIPFYWFLILFEFETFTVITNKQQSFSLLSVEIPTMRHGTETSDDTSKFSKYDCQCVALSMNGFDIVKLVFIGTIAAEQKLIFYDFAFAQIILHKRFAFLNVKFWNSASEFGLIKQSHFPFS